MNQSTEYSFPIMKLVSVWLAWAAALGIRSWGDAAQFAGFIASLLAAIYSLCLLSHWWWRHFWRPVFVWVGWANPLPVSPVIVDDDGRADK